MSLVVLRPSESVLFSSAISPSVGSVSRVMHTSSPHSKPERQCCSPAGGRISALTLYNVWQHYKEIHDTHYVFIFMKLIVEPSWDGFNIWAATLQLHFSSTSGKGKGIKVDLRWLCQAGTGSERVWKLRCLGWVERSQQRKRTGDTKAGFPSTSPPTGSTHCVYCTKASHIQKCSNVN